MSPWQTAASGVKLFWDVTTGTREQKFKSMIGLTSMAGASKEGIRYGQSQVTKVIDTRSKEEQKIWRTPYLATTTIEVIDVRKTIIDPALDPFEKIWDFIKKYGLWIVIAIIVVIIVSKVDFGEKD